MTKHSRELPVELIQNIQSFMESEAAAQTSLLSKSWYKAYSTRPILEFNSINFSNSNMFSNLVRSTVQRYLDLKIKVNKLVLKMEYYRASPPVVDKLIVHVLKLRMNVLHLYFWDGSQYFLPFVLPASVFANECLDELHLSTCHVHDLVPRNGLTRINASELRNLKTLIVEYDAFGICGISPSVICGQFLNLSRLELRNVSVDDSFFTNISSSFPNLEDLTLEKLNNNPTFQILSRSIRILSLKHTGIVKMAELDVPHIKNFKFSGDHIPPLSFTASKEWKSEIYLDECNLSDLSELREFLIKLGQSKITLHLSIGTHSRNLTRMINIENFHLPAMEELTSRVDFCEQYNFLVKCILCCRSKLVSLHFCLDYRHMILKTISIQFMYNKLIEQRNQNGCSTTTQNSELEEVNVELFEESLKQWQPIKTWSDDLEIPNLGTDTLRFKLKWVSLTPEYTIIKLIQYYHIDNSLDEKLNLIPEVVNFHEGARVRVMMYPSNI